MSREKARRSNLKSRESLSKASVPPEAEAHEEEEKHEESVKMEEEPIKIEELDHISFNCSMLKPSNIKQIWSGFKVHKAMFDFMQWYFRPRNSYEPERVDYNALNILAEYQTYNLEFLKNELDVTDEQTANVLEALWSLLEFDPDEKSVEKEIGGGDM